MLGEALLGQKKYAEAEPLLVKGYEGMKARAERRGQPGGPPAQERLAEALRPLVQLSDETHRPEEAARWRGELAAWFGRQLQRDFVWPLLWGWPRF
jgi:hypothetical protein